MTSARTANAVQSLAKTISWLMVWSMSAACVLTFGDRHARVGLAHDLADSGGVAQRVAVGAQREGHLLALPSTAPAYTGRTRLAGPRALSRRIEQSRRRRRFPDRSPTPAADLDVAAERDSRSPKKVRAKRSLTTATGRAPAPIALVDFAAPQQRNLHRREETRARPAGCACPAPAAVDGDGMRPACPTSEACDSVACRTPGISPRRRCRSP